MKNYHGKNEYMKEYLFKRYHAKLKEAISLLGGKCVQCGATDNLQFDHIDPSTKKFKITLMLSHSKKEVKEELKKCQLLCRECHDIKSIKESGKKVAKGTHGTLSSYRYCKCEECVKAHSDYMKLYRDKKPG